MKPSTELTKIPFHGDTLEVAQTDDGKVWISLKGVCESLGIALTPQLRKLRGYKWARLTTMIAQVDGRPRRIPMIELEWFPVWLVTMRPSRVAFETRIKLKAYQKEAKTLLSAQFPSRAPVPNLKALAAEMALLRECIEARNDRISDLESTLEREQNRRQLFQADANKRAKHLDSLRIPFSAADDSIPYMTLRDFCDSYEVVDALGMPLTAKKLRGLGYTLTTMSAHLGVAVRCSMLRKRGINLYRRDILLAWWAHAKPNARVADDTCRGYFDSPSPN